ncbi:hypothetical protein EVAR_8348_1 [Eumeta japonica]|uniref:Uncharacterized protein n=1 Tax=Eumeta variegata TaxID=151549 RepID=A0A4C1VFQ7_EUMVA|nr:hypothetical protein EVAR_8348_1 [Eumeta japonica]
MRCRRQCAVSGRGGRAAQDRVSPIALRRRGPLRARRPAVSPFVTVVVRRDAEKRMRFGYYTALNGPFRCFIKRIASDSIRARVNYRGPLINSAGRRKKSKDGYRRLARRNCAAEFPLTQPYRAGDIFTSDALIEYLQGAIRRDNA